MGFLDHVDIEHDTCYREHGLYSGDLHARPVTGKGSLRPIWPMPARFYLCRDIAVHPTRYLEFKR